MVPVVPAFEAVVQDSGRWTFRLRAPAAAKVELMGDFTHWEPIALARDAGGRWSATIAVPPGVHHLNVRVDGGAWGVPPGLPVLRDEFSGVVAVLIVDAPPAPPSR